MSRYRWPVYTVPGADFTDTDGVSVALAFKPVTLKI